jgi:hypothetical protein
MRVPWKPCGEDQADLCKDIQTVSPQNTFLDRQLSSKHQLPPRTNRHSDVHALTLSLGRPVPS